MHEECIQVALAVVLFRAIPQRNIQLDYCTNLHSELKVKSLCYRHSLRSNLDFFFLLMF